MENNDKRVELLYVWIKKYKKLKGIGFNLSNQFIFNYDPETKRLTKKEQTNFLSDYFPEPINNFSAIIGSNGAGKTTLLKILATIMNPSSGTVLINRLSVKDEAEKVRQSIGVVSHNTFLYNNLTAYENLDFYRRLYDMPKERILEVSAMVGMQNSLYEQ